MKRLVLLFIAVGLLYTASGFLPGRTFAPLDLPYDLGAWKHDPAQRVRVSNSLLSDVVVQFIPWDREILRTITRGELPWTNRWAGDGGPLFANPQTALFSPFTWPRLLFGLDGWAVMALLKLLAAALSAYWFSRELEIDRARATVSALVYATCGYSVVWLLWPHTNVFALLPALAASALRLMKTPAIRNAALVILFAALCTAGGHPETLFVGVVGIWIFLIAEGETRRDLGLMSIVPSTVGAFLGFLLLAVQLVPFFVIVGDSYTSAFRPQIEHPFRLWAIPSQILPGILGSPLRGELDLTAVVSAESFHHRAGGYVGALVLLAIIVAWKELPRALRRGLMIGAIALVLSWYPPGLWPLLRNVPLLRVVALEYGVVLFALFASIAAGPALAHLASRPRKKIGSLLAIIGIAALIAGVLPALPQARPMLTRVALSGIEQLRTRGHLHQTPEVYAQRLDDYLAAASTTTLHRVALPGAMALFAAFALLAPVRRRELLVSAAAIGELVLFGAGFNPAVPMTDVPPAPEIVRAVRELDPANQYLIASHFEIFPANLGTLYEVRDVVSYDVLNSKPRVTQLLAGGYDPTLHSVNPILSPEQVRSLARLGVRFVLSRSDVAGATRIAGPPAPAAGVYEIAGATPRLLPENHHPTGLYAGIVVSLLALLASAAWLRLYLLVPVPIEKVPAS